MRLRRRRLRESHLGQPASAPSSDGHAPGAAAAGCSRFFQSPAWRSAQDAAPPIALACARLARACTRQQNSAVRRKEEARLSRLRPSASHLARSQVCRSRREGIRSLPGLSERDSDTRRRLDRRQALSAASAAPLALRRVPACACRFPARACNFSLLAGPRDRGRRVQFQNLSLWATTERLLVDRHETLVVGIGGEVLIEALAGGLAHN